ncbi:hypothetical protein DH2020_025535 [Rehmannia glutinosa]|uniref:Reverse transcriptase Ty1/copia-type domain-containing protein n=1 Tax=Rehmannia glutinosa TaxID=99300 RepID=A0ABR0VZF8_REHGL
MDLEYNALIKNHTWDLVPFSEAMNLISNKWVFKFKHRADGSVDRLKTRLVARGFQQILGLDYFETFSPVVKSLTIRIMFSLVVSRGWLIQQVDINNTFLNGTLEQTQPWQTHSVLVYVDDILITGDDSEFVLSLIKKVDATFSLKHLGQVNYFLGIEAHRTSDGYLLNQPKYVSDLLAKTKMFDCKASPTPFCSGQKLSLGDSPLFSLPSLYRSTVGNLQYLTMTRPDITNVVHKLSQFLHAPTENHWVACKKVLRYLKGSRFLGIKFTSSPHMNLEAYVDADWASSCDDRKSIGGYCVFLGPNLLTWCSKKHQVVARSSTEAEYRSMAVATTDLVWIQALFAELGLHLESPAVLWCDNSSAISLASNPVFHQRTKHIEIDIHFIREKVQNKVVDVRFIPSESQIADRLTKPLSLQRFQFLCSKLSLTSFPGSL